MCFFGKQRYVAAIACLKRALYLDPFEWIISYNLGQQSARPTAPQAGSAMLLLTGARFPVCCALSLLVSGLVHLNTEQYASAFHYLSASINLKPDFPSSYMYLGITLSRLDDFENACSAYEKAIRMERSARTHKQHSTRPTPITLCLWADSFVSRVLCASVSDHLFELNYTITLFNHDEIDSVRRRHTISACTARTARTTLARAVG